MQPTSFPNPFLKYAPITLPTKNIRAGALRCLSQLLKDKPSLRWAGKQRTMESAPNWILTTLASQLCCSDKSLTFYSSLQACFVFVFNKIGWQMNCGIPSYSRCLEELSGTRTRPCLPSSQPTSWTEKELDLHLINGTNQNAKQWVNMSTTPPTCWSGKFLTFVCPFALDLFRVLIALSPAIPHRPQKWGWFITSDH